MLNVDQIIKDIEEYKRKELERLEKNSKNLSELVRDEKFIIGAVLGESLETSVTEGPTIIGGYNPSTATGYAHSLTLKVHGTVTAIKSIKFRGTSPVRSGDKIVVKIPRFKVHKSPGFEFSDDGKEYYLDRDYNSIEQAIEIAIIKGKRIARRDRSVDYHIYGLKQNPKLKIITEY